MQAIRFLMRWFHRRYHWSRANSASGFAIADSVMALVVMVAILYTAFDVFRSAFQTLSDKARIPEEEVRKVVEGIAGVRNAHRIRTRGTQGDVYADLHVLVDPNMTAAASA